MPAHCLNSLTNFDFIMSNIKVLTATSLFDGHDVSVNIFRRLLQQRGAEVIHLGHNRSVSEIITVALQEDVDGLLISSYQGGHNEYFRFLIDELKKNGAGQKLVFGGGGGVILPEEIKALEEYGVERIYHASDGQKIGISGIADDIITRIRQKRQSFLIEIAESEIAENSANSHFRLARQISFVESNLGTELLKNTAELFNRYDKKKSLVLGVTGTGGSGKSSMIDELIGRFLHLTTDVHIAVLAVDPSKSKTGGALLGDRIRYNQIYNNRVYFRSFATRQSYNELSESINDSVAILKSAGYDLIIVETSGIGQGDSRVAEVSDKSMYVMTAEFGAPTQLEKINMLDIADFIVLNKFEKTGSEDAYRELKINYIRNHQLKISHSDSLVNLELPVYAVSSNQFNNHGLNRLFKDLLGTLEEFNKTTYSRDDKIIDLLETKVSHDFGLISNRRINYLAEIADSIKQYHKKSAEQSKLAGDLYSIKRAMQSIDNSEIMKGLKESFEIGWQNLDEEVKSTLASWYDIKKGYTSDVLEYELQGKKFKTEMFSKTLCGSKLPKIALPRNESWEDILRFIFRENLPGYFPFTAGVFPFRRTSEDPKRQFAGEGGPERTNKRFHFLSAEDKAKRLSVAFDGITLYGEDPGINPDIYGKIGESGVSICTIDDMDTLLRGFDQLDPMTSVSMTINAPAPIMVAFYFMTAYKRELKKLENNGNELSHYEKEQLKLNTFRSLRGTVQADMLKEDQGQNTCIFSIDFAMKLIGDLQEYLSRNNIRNYYSLSISGYHIAEAGANPITQLAFTLANGFTYVEYFLNRGIPVDDFAPNLSFFFSNGMDPEYSVIGRVARRIWAVAMKYKYGANEKSQKLKYHIQTSGRSLHAQEIDFNDIRTTLQGLLAFYDNCNSLHTNSYDEAITTPTEESVRRSMAIQYILTNEFGMLKNENPNQGSYIMEELTDLVEEAVLQEFYNLSRRGGVLGAMETQYQRSKIQEQSMYYESLKQSGEYPIIGVNKFVRPQTENLYDRMLITRATDEEKNKRLDELEEFKSKNANNADEVLLRLRETALSGNNIFEELLTTVEYASMGQITQLLYEIGGKYRRGM